MHDWFLTRHLASFPDKKLPLGAEEGLVKGLPGPGGCFATLLVQVGFALSRRLVFSHLCVGVYYVDPLVRVDFCQLLPVYLRTVLVVCGVVR